MQVEGTVKEIVYQNEDNSYVVAKLDCDGKIVTIVGAVAYIFQGQILRVNGNILKHPVFGEQIKVETAEELQPDTIKGIEKYLSSGVINGIGPATAKRIVKKFGLDSFEVLDFNIDKLLEVEGIGEKKLRIIKESYKEARKVRNILVFLQTYGVTARQCMKIYYRFGQDSIQVVKENPYVLCEEVAGFGFKTADKIAMNLGIKKDSEFRIKSGLKHMLSISTSSGNTCLPLDELLLSASSALEVDKELILSVIGNMIIEEELHSENMHERQFVFLPQFHHYETNVASKIVEMRNSKVKTIKKDIESFIDAFEKRNSIKFHENQKEAIRAIKNNGFEIITGGPGTGKTTIIKCILEYLKAAGLKILMAAPTGRAAKRMTETTEEESKTIHRLLDIQVNDDDEEGEVDIDEEESDKFLDADCIIIDEASMVDIMLMNNLLKSVKNGTRLLMVGDVDQLPSVGPGKVLADLIESDFVKVVRLTHIYRQGKESMITENAHRINKGEEPIVNSKDSDFFFMGSSDMQKNIELIKSLVTDRLPKFNKSWNPKKDIQILSAMRKGDLGVDNLNSLMKEVLNGKSEKFKFTQFSEGDKVMQTRNNYQLKSRREAIKTDFTFEEETGVFNGDIGFVHSINEENQIVTVLFDDRYVDYTPLELDELELAYAITIHKSQGSEFKVVIIPAFMGPPLLMNRNLIYTAVTRAKQLLVVVGDRRALSYMVRNNKSFDRYTSLKYRLSVYKEMNG